jgi:hypothetical protein
MFIRCRTDNSSDEYYLPEINNMDELKEYERNNIPVEAYLLGGRCNRTIYAIEDMNFVHLNLNNYLYFYEIVGYYADQERIKEKLKALQEACCYNCRKNSDYSSNCVYVDDEHGGCKKHEERPMGFFERLFKKNKEVIK